MLPEWTGTNEHIYDSGGKLTESYSVPTEKLRTLVATYRYDANGRLTSIESSAGNSMEELRYTYDEEGRIEREGSYVKTEEEF